MKQAITLCLLICLGIFSFGKDPKHKHAKDKEEAAYHSPYDDSTLLARAGPILMPYNRFIDPVGAVVRFGNSDRESHALDCTLLPDGKTLAVEERFGMALIDLQTNKVSAYWEYGAEKAFKDFRSTYSGIKAIAYDNATHIFWSAADGGSHSSIVIHAVLKAGQLKINDTIGFPAFNPAPLALANDLAITNEGGELFLYVVLNGNNILAKVRLPDKKIIWLLPMGMAPYGIAITGSKAYVTNWAGPYPRDPQMETAGIPYGKVYIDHRTGGTLPGTVSVIDLKVGNVISEIPVGLHPNAIIPSPDGNTIYVANGNSDEISVISTETDKVMRTIPVRLGDVNPYVGDAPNALAINTKGDRLYVACGMDNAVAVVSLSGAPAVKGFIPVEAYPGGLALDNNKLYVCNLEGEGSRIKIKDNYNAHHDEATVSIVPIPADNELPALTKRVENACMQFRTKLSQLLPRPNAAARPVPDRIGEPSLIKHVIYVIKENRTYDQVLGDMKEGDGRSDLCIFGDTVTPNEHRIARDFLLLDNYYASGKSSAEGHQWTDAAMTSDYVEKAVRAWFRSYPHVQNDALVENKEGFIWNDALDHGKSVRIYGEACLPEWDGSHDWQDMNKLYKSGKPFHFKNVTTISRVQPIMSTSYPCGDVIEIPDQMRADAFIRELKEYEAKDGDQWPQLMIIALPDDHTAATNPKMPTPKSMVADNDLALGRIVDAVTRSRFWDSTAIFVTEDDSQDGWDHVSAYRTTGFVLSPYSRLHSTVHTDYNQTCIVRTIEQILGIPPMNAIDATALPMFDCFAGPFDRTPYTFAPNTFPLDQMNKPESMIHGEELHYERLSSGPQFAHIDQGDEDTFNHILWFYAMGKKPYPHHMTLPKKGRKDKDDD